MRKLAGTLPYFLTYLDEAQSFSTQLTSELLINWNIVPKPVAEYLPNVIAPYVRRTQPTIPPTAAFRGSVAEPLEASVLINSLA
jgi:hypothetical protein